MKSKKAAIAIIAVISVSALVGAITVIALPATAAAVGAVATVIAAAGTLITVLFSTLSNREAMSAAKSAEETASLARKSEAAIELPALRAQKRLWAKELERLSNTPYEHLYNQVDTRIDQASARELELLGILGLTLSQSQEDESFWDEPDNWPASDDS